VKGDEVTRDKSRVTRILVTGAAGFVGRNLVAALRRVQDFDLTTYDIYDQRAVLDGSLKEADLIFHLAGVNRPERPTDFEVVNTGLTREIADTLVVAGRHPTIVFSSSTQAELENPYGVSKKRAEEVLQAYAGRTSAAVCIFRLPGVFGKWCRPNYNSVVATFCYNVAHGIELVISDPNREVELAYVDDVVKEMVREATNERVTGGGVKWGKASPKYRVTLGSLAAQIRGLGESRRTLRVPDFSDRFTKCLYATYLSYLEGDDLAYDLSQKADNRGELAELLRSGQFGQIFVSRTKPGVTRGNHYHDLKTEKFCVVEGEGVVRLRHILGKEVISYFVSGRDFKVVDIPPGYTHSIENVGKAELVTLFWACEPFDQSSPDTYPMEVHPDKA
jgi:UDP-2-acetamido-2,6-beta-L-arabino-hexul-4-ose reductase